MMNTSFTFAKYRYGVTLRHFDQSRKRPDETRKFFQRICRHIGTLKLKFPNISIPVVNSKDNYGCIFYEKENQRGPLLSFIRHHIDYRFTVKTNNKLLDKAHEPEKRLQFKAWSSNSKYMSKMENFLLKFNYTKKNSLTRITINRRMIELSWICEESKVRNMIAHWDGQNIPIELVQSNYNQHLAKQKENAKIALQQCARYAVTKVLDGLSDDKFINLVKFHSNKIFEKDIPPVTEEDIAYTTHQYPFLHIFNSTISPKTDVDIKKHKLRVSVLNIDGGATEKLQNHHPYINRLIKTHFPHLMVFLDIRKQTIPNIHIPGYTLMAFSPGDKETLHSIGGILIY